MRGVVLGLLACGLAACGRVGFDPFGDGGTGSPDGVIGPPRCDPTKPYGEPVRLDKISSSFPEIGVKLADDKLSGLLWTASGPDRIYETTRRSTADEFVDRRLMTELLEPGPNPESDRDPGISGDGLFIVFSSFRAHPGGGGDDWDLWGSARPSRDAPFRAPVPLSTLNTPNNNWGATLSSSNLAIYYVEGEDLTMARRGMIDEPFFRDPVGTMDALNGPGPDFEPVVSADERTIFFSTVRGTTDFDIWYSQRPSRDHFFPAPQPLLELTQGGDEWAGWVSPDLCELYFARSNGPESWDLYITTRPL